ncbi:unnamed protein product [Effrenium voratum]|uniref:Aminotransferase class V domain-containing protein n=1 Tax=Effrenium voratum TaxID=2562239 RepID=A0AA36MRB3_9DINO|nr:unnamed protein product [Effrenium voratum]
MKTAAAALLNCDPAELAVTESAQSAWAKAFASLDFRPGDRIFCWESEYAGNAVALLQAKRRFGVQLEVLPMRQGRVDVERLEAELVAFQAARTGRALVALCHLQTNSSVVQPAEAVGQVARRHQAVFLLDTCQTIGQMPVDLRRLGCDFACATGRKWLRGPRGTGLLYARGDCQWELVGEPCMLDHVSAHWTSPSSYHLAEGARRFEMWETSPALHAGLAAALQLCSSIGPERIWERATMLARRLRGRLQDMGLTCCDAEAEPESRAAIVTFAATRPAQEIKEALAARRIAVSVSPRIHSFNESDWKEPPVVRLSPSYYNTEDEIDAAAAALREILEEKT